MNTPPLTLPEPLAAITEMRKAEIPDSKIAAKLGITRRFMWQKIAIWNRAHPGAPIPRPATRPATPRYEQAAALAQQGLAESDVAKQLGLTEARAKALLRKAREKGLLPSRPSRRNAGGMATYQYYQDKNAAPQLGHMQDIIGALTSAEVETLLRVHGRKNAAIADTIAQVLKDFLRDQG